MEEFLTEQNLGIYLKQIYGYEWIHNKSFINRKRPDYRDDKEKLIVEFDGPRHYTSSSRIIQDEKRDKFYLDNGYRTIRIPMFIQMSSKTIKLLFDKTYDFKQIYKHGFISDLDSLVLPADFCELGILKFKRDLEYFSCVKQDIIDSLKVKIEKLRDINLVLPPSLHYLVK